MTHAFIITPINLGVTWVTREDVAQTEERTFVSTLKDLDDSNPALELGLATFYFIKVSKMITQFSVYPFIYPLLIFIRVILCEEFF